MVLNQAESSFKNYIQNDRVLWCSGIVYLVVSLCFVAVMMVWDFLVIDEYFVGQDILDGLASLNHTQKQVHIIATMTLDVIYPFAYGIFQAGMAYRYLGKLGRYIAPLSLVCIPIDLIEGFVQVMLLSGNLGYVESKTIVTPIKLALYLPGALAALIALGIAIMRKVRN